MTSTLTAVRSAGSSVRTGPDSLGAMGTIGNAGIATAGPGRQRHRAGAVIVTDGLGCVNRPSHPGGNLDAHQIQRLALVLEEEPGQGDARGLKVGIALPH